MTTIEVLGPGCNRCQLLYERASLAARELGLECEVVKLSDSNLLAATFGAFMYFATLTEVPIVQGLLGSGMGKGPALALLLAGPALSLPSMLVIRGILGTRKTVAYVALVIGCSTITGIAFGALSSAG